MKKELTTKSKVQLGVVALLVILFVVFILLNMQVVEVNLIFAKIEVSRSVMLLATFATGALAGWFLKSWTSFRKKKKSVSVE